MTGPAQDRTSNRVNVIALVFVTWKRCICNNRVHVEARYDKRGTQIGTSQGLCGTLPLNP
jgi:hypothetical protein